MLLLGRCPVRPLCARFRPTIPQSRGVRHEALQVRVLDFAAITPFVESRVQLYAMLILSKPNLAEPTFPFVREKLKDPVGHSRITSLSHHITLASLHSCITSFSHHITLASHHSLTMSLSHNVTLSQIHCSNPLKRLLRTPAANADLKVKM